MSQHRPLAIIAAVCSLVAACSPVERHDREAGAISVERSLRAVLAPGLGRSYTKVNTCFGDWAEDDVPRSEAFDQGTRQDGGAVDAARSDPALAAGGPDGQSVALGFGGTLLLRFPEPVRDGEGADLVVHESSPGVARCEDGPEQAELWVSHDGLAFHRLPGRACAGEGGRFDLASLPADADWRLRYFGARFARVVDVSRRADFAGTPDADGFDLDSVEGVRCGGQAAPVHLCDHGATEVIHAVQGVGVAGAPVPPDASELQQALDLPQEADGPVPVSWYTLGRGGEIVLGFGGPVLDGPGADLQIAEATFSKEFEADAGCDAYPEQAQVEAYGTDSRGEAIRVELGTICQDAAIDLADAGLAQLDALRLVDSTDFITGDGFDLDGIGCPAP